MLESGSRPGKTGPLNCNNEKIWLNDTQGLSDSSHLLAILFSFVIFIVIIVKIRCGGIFQKENMVWYLKAIMAQFEV